MHQPLPLEQLGHLGHQILRLRAQDALSGHQDDVVVSDLGSDLTPGRPQDTPGAIPIDRTANPTGGDHGELP